MSKNARNDEFLSALIAKYQLDEGATDLLKVEFTENFFAWIVSGHAIARYSGMSKLGVNDAFLVIKQRAVVKMHIPDIAIPKSQLCYLGTRFVWSAMHRLDVFRVSGLNSGQLLLPVSLIEK